MRELHFHTAATQLTGTGPTGSWRTCH